MLNKISLFSCVIILLASAGWVAAQDDADPITVDGALSMQPVLQVLADGFDAETPFEINANGPNAAFEAFCNGELDVVMASRFISPAEATACDSNSVAFIENLLALQGVVFVTSGQLESACFSINELDTVLGIAGEGTDPLAASITGIEPNAPLTLYLPAEDSTARDVLRAVLPSNTIRADVEGYQDVQATLDAMNEAGEYAIMALSLKDFDNATIPANISPLSLRSPQSGNCTAPSATTVETLEYPAGRYLMLYTSEAALATQAGLTDFFAYVSGEGKDRVAEDFTLTRANDASYARNDNNINAPFTGRSFSRPTEPSTVSAGTGTEAILAGDPLAARVAGVLNPLYSTSYPSNSLENRLLSADAAYEALCAGDASVILVVGEPGEPQADLCTQNERNLISLPVATEAIVFAVAAANDDLPVCMDVETLAQAFMAPLGDDMQNADERDLPTGIVNWNALDDSFPDAELFIFTQGRSSFETAWLFDLADMPQAFGRSDEEANVVYGAGDFRATAVANLEGAGLAVLSWADVQDSERADDLRLLEIDAGEGCIAPTEATIADGSYAFGARIWLATTDFSLGDSATAAYVWNLQSATVLDALEDSDIALVDRDALATQRDTLFDEIEAAGEAAAERAAAEAEAAAEEEAATEDESSDGDDATEDETDEDTE